MEADGALVAVVGALALVARVPEVPAEVRGTVEYPRLEL
jgi:hypothetical protein